MTSNRSVAIDLARAGLSVFPVSTRTKAPAVPEGENWQLHSTIHPQQVEQWPWPSCMAAINLRKNALLVIDADRHGGPDGVAAFEEIYRKKSLPSGIPIIRTPNDGLHFYFNQPRGRKPLGNSRGNLPTAIDVKGLGGYIVAPGAILADGRRYEHIAGPDLADAYNNAAIPEIPDWLIDIIEAPRRAFEERKTITTIAPRNADTDQRWAIAALNAERAKIAGSIEGLRNETLFSSSLALGELISAKYFDQATIELALLAAARAAGVNEREAIRTIKSGIARGLNSPRYRPEREYLRPTARRYPFKYPHRVSL